MYRASTQWMHTQVGVNNSLVCCLQMLRYLYIHSTTVISNSKGLTETFRDIRT